MKGMFFLIFVFLVNSWDQVQNDVRLPSFYKGCGIIFSEESKINVHLELGELFEPSIEDVEKSELILYENLRVFLEDRFSRTLKEHTLTPLEIDTWKKTIKNANSKKQYRNFNRQYAGFISDEKEKLIYIRLLNFSKPSLANRYFENWKEEIVIGFGDFYEENTRVFVINIDQNEIVR